VVADEVRHVRLRVPKASEYLVRADDLIGRPIIVAAQIVYLDAEQDADDTVKVVLPPQCLILEVREEIFPLLRSFELRSNHHRLSLNVCEQDGRDFFRSRVRDVQRVVVVKDHCYMIRVTCSEISEHLIYAAGCLGEY